jgi:ADP-dependent NAD(P)H-hydrate dehydratase
VSGPTPVTPELLRATALPRHEEGEDKDQRGRVLVVAGSAEVPGAALLCGVGALRAGAGKLRIATCRGVAPQLGVAVPEAFVMGLDETPGGGISADEADKLAASADRCDALLIGPGMANGDGEASLLTTRLLDRMEGGPGIVLDAAALFKLHDCAPVLRRHAGRVVVTPHAGEMATLLGVPREEVLADPLGAARRTAAALGVVVAMKGGNTFVVSPQGAAWSSDRGNVGLATSGSGDTLAGVVAGLLARGATPVDATLWGVFLHGEAGNRLARSRGPVGFLARELLAEIPSIMAELDTGAAG